ncbi:MAG: YdcF family protein [Bryobacteraceae bacterium]
MLTAAGRILVENDKPEKADAEVVLGGDEFGARITKAAQLATAGYAPYVLVSAPRTLLGHESDITIEYARRRGYPVSLFRPFNHELNSTRSEAELIDRYLRSQNAKRILLVTSNYHTARAARLLRKYSPGLQVIAVAAPDPNFTPDGWWKTREGQKTFLYEWLKTIATASGN